MDKKEKIKTQEKENRAIKNLNELGFFIIVLMIFIIPLYFNIKAYDQFELPKLTVLRVLTSLLLGIWLLRSIELNDFSIIKTPLDFPFLLWIFINIICTFTSFAPHLSFRGEYENFAGSLSNINYVILFFLAMQFIKNTQHLHIILIALLLSGLLTTFYSIAQFFGYDFIKWNEESVIKGRYFASMGNPNFLGAFLIMVIPIIISYFIIMINKKNKLLVFLLFIYFILIYLALFGTQSRGPFLGFVFSLFIFLIYGVFQLYKNIIYSSEQQNISKYQMLFLLLKKNIIWISGIILFIIITFIYSFTLGKNATNRILESISNIPGSLKQSRLHIWIPALKIIKDHPILGTGVDTFKAVFPKYEGLDFAYIDGTNVSSRTAHNELLNIAATMGLIGLAIYILIIYVYIKIFLKSFKEIKNFDLKLVSLGIFAAFVAYFIQNLFSFGVAAINTTLYIFFAIHGYIYNSIYGIKKYNLKIKSKLEPTIKIFLQSISIIIALFLAFRAYNMLQADYSYNKGKILGNIYNRWDLAIKEHIKSVEKEPFEVKYHVYLGLAYEQLAIRINDTSQQINLIKKSIEAYKKGIELNPGNSYYWGNLGRVYSLLAKIENKPDYYSNSINYYLEAIKRAPITGIFYHNLIEIYLKNNLFKEAIETYEKLEYCDKKLAANSAFLFGNLFFANQDFKNAALFYEKAVNFVPDFYQAYYNLGITYISLKEKEKAKKIFEDLLNKKPDFEKADEIKMILTNLQKK